MVPTNSNRQKVQLFIESSIHCSGAEDLKRNENLFKGFLVTNTNISELELRAEKDAVSLYEKGSQSFLQGVDDLLRGYEAWAVVKFYYSTFYFLRCRLAMQKISLVRCRNIYTLEIVLESTPQNCPNKCRGSDHKATFEIFKRELGEEDILSSQSIGEENPYDWLMGRREWINYRSNSFPEALNQSYFCSTLTYSIEEQIELFLNDDVPIYCFDKDYACLALPLKCAELTSKEFTKNGFSVSSRFKKFIKPRLEDQRMPNRLFFLCP